MVMSSDANNGPDSRTHLHVHFSLITLVNWLLLFPNPAFVAYNTVDREIFTVKNSSPGEN